MKFRKKPIVIEAEQWSFGKDIKGVVWGVDQNGRHAWVETLEGRMQVLEGDWIITGTAGEIYPCKDRIFKEIYEKVEDSQ